MTSDPHMAIRREYETSAKPSAPGPTPTPDAPPRIPTRRDVWAEIKGRVNARVIDQHRPFTIAYAWVTNYKRAYYLAYGATRCCHKDEWNPTTGANIAKGRAISNLLDTIMASLKGEA